MFYRFHWDDCPEFGPANAYSALWGSERTGDGSQTVCGDCNGRRRLFEFDEENCPTCDGEGVEDCAPGYSACHDLADLIGYFAERGEPDDDHGQVIVFDGNQVGNGPDGEPLVIPTQIIRTMTWTEAKGTR